MLYFVTLFIFNIVFNNLFLNSAFNRNIDITFDILNNLQNDFLSIGFPFLFTIDSLLISIFLSLILTGIIFKNFKIDNKTPDPIEVLRELGQLFLLYSGLLFSVFYLLRIYNLSRGIILFALVLYPIFTYMILYFFRFKELKSLSLKRIVSFSILLLLTFAVFYSRSFTNEELRIDSVTTTTTTTSTIFQPGIVETDCSPWLGSDNFDGCINGVEIFESTYFSESLNNVITHENDIYVLDVFGKVFKNTPENIFIDISNKVLNRFEFKGDSGLFSLAFHPDENYFIISYSNLENNLIFEKYLLDENKTPILSNSEIVYKIPNANCCHYSGNIIWSDFFSDFIISIGDMEHTDEPFENSKPLDTTSPVGKILLLNNEVSNPVLLASSNKIKPLKNIIAYGLRNPWKTYVYKNYLFIQDVGLSTEEELNILNLEDLEKTNKPFLLGWPHYEANIDNNVKYNEIYFYDNGVEKNINQFIDENTIFPNVFYTHVAPENYRAAIIGGEIIKDTGSKYYENYFFADYLSGEIFSYDFKNNRLKIIPLGESYTLITSLSIHPFISDAILISTSNGDLVQIKLP